MALSLFGRGPVEHCLLSVMATTLGSAALSPWPQPEAPWSASLVTPWCCDSIGPQVSPVKE